MVGTRFDVSAKLPDGSAKDDFPEMLQALLAERFHLTVHRESRERTVYALVVANGGAKLTEASSDPSGASVQKLGLKLEKRKTPVEYIVIDHLDRVPTAK